MLLLILLISFFGGYGLSIIFQAKIDHIYYSIFGIEYFSILKTCDIIIFLLVTLTYLSILLIIIIKKFSKNYMLYLKDMGIS